MAGSIMVCHFFYVSLNRRFINNTKVLSQPRAKVQKILDEANKKADDVLIKAKAESDKKLQ